MKNTQKIYYSAEGHNMITNNFFIVKSETEKTITLQKVGKIAEEKVYEKNTNIYWTQNVIPNVNDLTNEIFRINKKEGTLVRKRAGYANEYLRECEENKIFTDYITAE